MHGKLETESFSKEWKKASIISVHKKSDKQLITNYRPVSLLPICEKVFLTHFLLIKIFSTVANPDLDMVIYVYINLFQ